MVRRFASSVSLPVFVVAVTALTLANAGCGGNNGEETRSPSPAPSTTPSPVASQTPGSETTPTPSPSASPIPGTEPSPPPSEPTPSPTPTPIPAPEPSRSPEPTPTPTPMPTPTPGAELASRLRIVKSGDKFQYGLSGTVTRSTGAVVEVRGNATVTAVGDNYNNEPAIFLKVNSVIEGNDLRIAREYVLITRQNDSRTMRIFARREAGVTNALLEPKVLLPGEWFTGYKHDESYSYADNTTARHIFQITRDETVIVDAGTFRTWRVEQKTTDKDGNTNGIVWYAPQIGGAVKAQTTQEDKDGRVIRLTAQLREYTLVP